MPYQRFTTPQLLERAKRYLNSSRSTYRDVVRHERQCIGYPVQQRPTPSIAVDPPTVADPPSSPAAADRSHQASSDTTDYESHQPVISHTLIWRFVGWLGCLTLSLNKAREMILQQNPTSQCHRLLGSVDPFKARSEKRMATLMTARQLLLIMPEWEDCFGRPFFPQFATRAGFD